MDKGPQLGQLIDDGDRRRDAFHIAVAPVTAATRLAPGQHVGQVQEGDFELVGPCNKNIGIVDPFLADMVEPGQRFWLLLYPDTITRLRHVWSHPTFKAAPTVAIGRGEFLIKLLENEDDTTTRLIFADWLDDHGEHEEADRQRRWPAAKEWLVQFCKEKSHCHEFSYDGLIEFGCQVAKEDSSSESISFSDNKAMWYALKAHSQDYWTNWSVVTGIPLPPGLESKGFHHWQCCPQEIYYWFGSPDSSDPDK